MSDNPIIKDDLLVLRASAAATSTQTGTGKAIGPTGLAKAVVIVSAITSTPSIVVDIQEDDALGGSYATVATFPAITAVGTYELPFRANKKYVRYLSTHGDADSITYETFVTTAEK